MKKRNYKNDTANSLVSDVVTKTRNLTTVEELSFHLTEVVKTSRFIVIFIFFTTFSEPSWRPCWCWALWCWSLWGLTQNYMIYYFLYDKLWLY